MTAATALIAPPIPAAARSAVRLEPDDANKKKPTVPRMAGNDSVDIHGSHDSVIDTTAPAITSAAAMRAGRAAAATNASATAASAACASTNEGACAVRHMRTTSSAPAPMMNALPLVPRRADPSSLVVFVVVI